MRFTGGEGWSEGGGEEGRGYNYLVKVSVVSVHDSSEGYSVRPRFALGLVRVQGRDLGVLVQVSRRGWV